MSFQHPENRAALERSSAISFKSELNGAGSQTQGVRHGEQMSLSRVTFPTLIMVPLISPTQHELWYQRMSRFPWSSKTLSSLTLGQAPIPESKTSRLKWTWSSQKVTPASGHNGHQTSPWWHLWGQNCGIHDISHPEHPECREQLWLL